MLAAGRLAVRRRALEPADGLLRIGYAAGTRTHQRDFSQCAAAVADMLRQHEQCRLVLFRNPDGTSPCVDVAEFPTLDGLHHKIEWRHYVSPDRVLNEVARFDVNLAPLEVENP